MIAACQRMYGFYEYISSSVCCCCVRVFENRVLRRMFWPIRDELTRECRKLQNEELNDLYSSPNIIG